jgi:hypothetical protein
MPPPALMLLPDNHTFAELIDNGTAYPIEQLFERLFIIHFLKTRQLYT